MTTTLPSRTLSSLSLRHTTVASALFFLYLAPIPDASAIIIRHDIDDNEYVVDDADYPGLVDLFEPGDCIGSVITEDMLLTVAHCAEDLRTSDSVTINGNVHSINTILLHPDWDGWNNDIALIQLDTPVNGITPYSIYTGSDELGQLISIVGRGVTATGLQGERQAEVDGQLRRATNIVSAADSQWIEIHFEEPEDEDSTVLEGVGASGDSGCPVFLETADGMMIVGLNSWGEGSGSVRIGQYGSWDYQTRVSQFTDWINQEILLSGDDSTSNADSPPSNDSNKPSAGCSSSPLIEVHWLLPFVLMMSITRRFS